MYYSIFDIKYLSRIWAYFETYRVTHYVSLQRGSAKISYIFFTYKQGL